MPFSRKVRRKSYSWDRSFRKAILSLNLATSLRFHRTFSELKFLPASASLIERSPATHVILIPSIKDVTSRHVVFPQSPLDREAELGLPKRIKLLPNPAIFSINEVVFALTSTDTLFHLRNQEFFKKATEIDEETSAPATEDNQPKDIMARAVRQILRQRTFYPLFPTPTGPGIDSVNLDVSHMDLLRFGEVGADVVILPSMLKHFVKVAFSCLSLPTKC